MPIPASELILNTDGSIYHLHLRPEHIAHTIITVGDPDRVDTVTSYFDHIEFSIQKREFKTTTGVYKQKRITVISTGIGTDNIDIVLNELDALVNIDFNTRTVKKSHTALDIIRIGTSGAIQTHILIDTFLMSTIAIGLDALLHFYNSTHIQDIEMQKAFVKHMQWLSTKSEPYIVSCDTTLANMVYTDKVIKGFTATNIGFYGPQGRTLRLETSDPAMNAKLATFRYGKNEITNLEMETAGIYGLSKLLGHRALSLNAILANRANGTFSKQPDKTIKELIIFVLDRISNSPI